MTESRTGSLPDEAATQALGAALAGLLPPGAGCNAVLQLRGELGAGKSTLARALLRALGVTGSIRSPTYTLVERYPTPAGECLHLDLYRIADPTELDFLGLDELADEARLWLLEWPERGGDRLPPCDLRLCLEHAPSGRRFQLQACSARAREWLRGLPEHFGPG